MVAKRFILWNWTDARLSWIIKTEMSFEYLCFFFPPRNIECIKNKLPALMTFSSSVRLVKVKVGSIFISLMEKARGWSEMTQETASPSRHQSHDVKRNANVQCIIWLPQRTRRHDTSYLLVTAHKDTAAERALWCSHFPSKAFLSLYFQKDFPTQKRRSRLW